MNSPKEKALKDLREYLSLRGVAEYTLTNTEQGWMGRWDAYSEQTPRGPFKAVAGYQIKT